MCRLTRGQWFTPCGLLTILAAQLCLSILAPAEVLPSFVVSLLTFLFSVVSHILEVYGERLQSSYDDGVNAIVHRTRVQRV